jgi:parallel beta-helix repeat protein
MPNLGKSLALLLVITFIISLVILLPSIKAQFQGDITINVDGSIDPSAAPIQQKDRIYTLTNDIAGTLTVNKNHSVLDGNGYRLTGAVIILDASNVTVKNFIVFGGRQFGEIPKGLVAGIYLSNSSRILLSNNSISNVLNFVAVFEYYETVAGVFVEGGNSNIISSNNLTDNFLGIGFKDSNANLILENSVTFSLAVQKAQGYNDPAGLSFDNSSNNRIYHNNFMVSIGRQAGDSNSANIWDDGYPSGGNFWSDYLSKHPHAQMIDDSGIGNVSYAIDSQNNDNYPLMSPFDFNLYLFRTTKPEIQLLFSENRTFSSNNVTLSFTVDKATSWIGYSLDGLPNATVSSNFTITNLTNGQHDIAIYANDTFGNMGVQTANFNVELATPANSSIVAQTFPIIATVGILVAIAVSLLLFRKHRKTTK